MTVTFTTDDGVPRKVEEIKKHLPHDFKTEEGSNLGGLLEGIGLEELRVAGSDPTTVGRQAARDGMALDKATGDDLVVIGQNYGVSKPTALTLSDDEFRRFIQMLALKPKQIRARIEEFLAIILGDKETVGWDVYELRPNVITIDLGRYSGEAGPTTATYLHDDATEDSTEAFPGDYTVEDSSEDTPGELDVSTGIPDNGLYLAGDDSTFNSIGDVLRFVRAAGVKVEFKRSNE